MAKWIYVRWGIKWDISNPDYIASSIPSIVYPIDIVTLQASETGVTEMDAPGMVLSSKQRDNYIAGELANCQYGLPGQMGNIPQFSITQSTLAQRRLKDERLEDVVLEEGTVPDDGIHTDGYWYVKVKLAFPTMRILRDGQWAEVETGFVLKGGVWKPIEEIYKLQDGQWVQA